MFTRSAGVGSTEARRAGANGAWIKAQIGGPEEKLRSRVRAGNADARRLGCDSGDVHCHFMYLHRPVSTKRCLCCATVDLNIAPFSSIRKDRKRGCTYDQGALKNQTLRYFIINYLFDNLHSRICPHATLA